MIIPDLIYSAVANKCPRCHEGKVFANNNPYSFKKPFEMKETCSSCNLKYEREPGFFYGALYVSYALTSGIFILWFFADLFWIHMSAGMLATVVALTILISFPVIFRLARIIWLNFFVRFDKKYSHKKQDEYHSEGSQRTHAIEH